MYYGVLIQISLGYSPLEGRFCTCSAPVCRSPSVYCYTMLPLDLHVLSLPLAFILSQDQTLHRIVFRPAPEGKAVRSCDVRAIFSDLNSNSSDPLDRFKTFRFPSVNELFNYVQGRLRGPNYCLLFRSPGFGAAKIEPPKPNRIAEPPSFSKKSLQSKPRKPLRKHPPNPNPLKAGAKVTPLPTPANLPSLFLYPFFETRLF